MSESKPSFLDGIRGPLGQRPERAHPDVAQLEAFHWGDLAQDARAAIEDHIAQCPECLQAVRGLDEMAESTLPELTTQERLTPSPERDLVSFRKLLRQARDELPKTEQDAASEVKRRENWRDFRSEPHPTWKRAQARWLGAAASILLVVTAALAWFASSQVSQRRIAELEAKLHMHEAYPVLAPIAHAGTPILYAKRSTRGAPSTVLLPEGAEVFVVILDTSGYEDLQLAVSIFDAQQKLIWDSAGLQQNEFFNLAVTLSRQLFPEKSYQLRVYGPDGTSATPILEVAIELAG